MSEALDPAPPRMPTAPRRTPPRGACDTHAHVFGPYDRFPLVGPPSYAPPLAPYEVYREMLESVGMDRGVLVQPAPYGTDPRVLCDALERGAGRLAGISVASADISDTELAALDGAGVRGLRFTEMQGPGGGRYKGSVGADDLMQLAPRMRELGWLAQIWATCADCARLARELEPLGLPLVFDHLTQVNVQAGPGDPAFREILARLADGAIWLKLSLCRNAKIADYPALRPFHDALVRANPDRLLWGSDFPFVRMGENAPDVGHLLDLFQDWVGDEALVRRILVENPVALYRLPALPNE